jgi:protein O-mannosyl-transferase
MVFQVRKQETLATLLPVFLLTILLAAVFSPVWQFDFVNFDDTVYLTQNPHVRHGFTWAGIKWAFSLPTLGRAAEASPFWRPLTYLSHMFDMELYGGNAGGHHATSMLFHFFNVIMLFFIFFKITGERWKSFVVAAIFAIHPLQVESTAWVSARNNVLSAFFALWAVVFYLRFLKKGARINFVAMTMCFAFCLMSKSAAVTLPFLLVLLDFWPLQRKVSQERGLAKLWRLVIEKWPLFALSFFSCSIALVSRPSILKSQTTFGLGLFQSVVSYGFYLRKAFWPTALTVYRTWPPLGLLSLNVLGPFVLIASVTLLCVFLYKKQPFLAVGWFWFLLALLPASILPTPADRYMYLPIVGLGVIVAWAVPCFLTHFLGVQTKTILAACFAISLLVLTSVSRAQVLHWKDGVSFFQHLLSADPEHYFGQVNLGNALAERGQITEALEHYKRAIQIAPKQVAAYENLGTVLVKQNNFSGAKVAFQKIVEIKPDDWHAYFALGVIAQKEHLIAEAAALYSKAISLKPDAWHAHHNLGAIFAVAGKDDLAIHHYRKSLEYNANNAKVQLNLAKALLKKGNEQESKKYFKNAMALLPETSALRAEAEATLNALN